MSENEFFGVVFLSAVLGAIGGAVLSVILFFVFQEYIAAILLENILS